MGCGKKEKTTATYNDKWTRKTAEPQIAFMKQTLPYYQKVIQQLQPVISGLLTQPGLPTAEEEKLFRQERERAGLPYDTLAQTVSERLAGKGRLDSGIMNKMMETIGTQRAKAQEGVATNEAVRQYNELINAIRLALGYGGMASGSKTQIISPFQTGQVTNKGTDWLGLGESLGKTLATMKLASAIAGD